MTQGMLFKLMFAASFMGAASLNATNVLWRNVQTGDLGMWRLTGTHGIVAGSQTLSWPCTPANGCSNTFKVVGTGNFFGETDHAAVVFSGKNCATSIACKKNRDILWHNPVTGELQVWFVDSTGKVGEVRSLAWRCGTDGGCSDAWKAVGVGDFNNDGNSDILWHNPSTGQIGYWALDGNCNILDAPLFSAACGPESGCSTDYRIAATGDFNGDGNEDILFQHPSDNALAIWLIDGHANVTRVVTVPHGCAVVQGCTLTSTIVGAADLNGDLNTDVLWYDAGSGVLTAWLLDNLGHVLGTQQLSWTCDPSTACPAIWQPAGILWQ